MLRQAQHERKNFNNLSTKPVRPEPVEGRGLIFSPQIKKETYRTSEDRRHLFREASSASRFRVRDIERT